MTETRTAASRNQTAALVGLLTLVILVSLSPLGTQLLFPMIGETFATAWNQLGVMASWIGSNVLAPVFGLLGSWIGGLFA
jgi:hypothetical protein